MLRTSKEATDSADADADEDCGEEEEGGFHYLHHGTKEREPPDPLVEVGRGLQVGATGSVMRLSEGAGTCI